MSIGLAFSTLACPQWSPSQVIEQAAAMGYQGVELVTRFGRQTPTLACDPQQADPSQLRKELAQAGITPVCLSANVSFSAADETQGQASVRMARQAIELAASIGASAVRLLAWDIPPGQTDRQTLDRVAQRAREVADFAGQRGVLVLFENIGAFPGCRDWWWCMDVARHPMVGLAWNATSSSLIGEKPAVWGPMLNTRIKLVKLTDYVVEGKTPRAMPLGEGSLDVPAVIHRLMGIGYSGFVSVEWDRLTHPSLADASAVLPAAREKLTAIIEAVEQAAEARKPPRKTLPATAAAIAAKAASVKKPASTLAAAAVSAPAEAEPVAKTLPDAAAARAAKLAAAKAKSEARKLAAQGQESAADAPAADAPPANDPAAIRAAKLAAAKAKSEARRQATHEPEA